MDIKISRRLAEGIGNIRIINGPPDTDGELSAVIEVEIPMFDLYTGEAVAPSLHRFTADILQKRREELITEIAAIDYILTKAKVGEKNGKQKGGN
jgi:hypothetical protein